MKTKLLVAACLLGGLLSAQPVIQDGNSRPGVGFTTPVSMSTVPTSEGSAGANQTWDYSAVSFTPMGDLTVIDVATSPYASYFAAANYAMAFNIGGNMVYTYQNYSATKMEELAATVPAPGAEHDYTPNPPTRLVFPMSMGTSASDTWQKVNQSANPVTITCDAYGTFISPYHTYTNVVRVANDYGSNEIDYSFWATSPLRLLAVHRHADDMLVLLDGANVSVGENSVQQSVSVFPNPVVDKFTLSTGGSSLQDPRLELYDLSGALLRQIDLVENQQSISRGALPAGVYFYRLLSGEAILNSGKLIFQ